MAPTDRIPFRLDPAAFAHALRAFAAEHDLTQADLASRLDVTQQTVSDWMNERKEPSRKNLDRVLAKLSIPLSAVKAADHGAANFVLIPHDGTASAGPGSVNGEHGAPRAHPYPVEVVQQLTGFAPANELRSFTIIGDSLAPEIGPNTPAIYRVTRDFIGDGLYVLHVDGVEVCKIVQYLPGGAIILSSYNDKYRDVHLTPLHDADTPGTFREDETGLTTQVQIVGKVVFYPKPA